MQYTMYYGLYTVYCILCFVFCVRSNEYRVLYTMYGLWYTVHRTPYIVPRTQYIVHSTQYTVHRTPYGWLVQCRGLEFNIRLLREYLLVNLTYWVSLIKKIRSNNASLKLHINNMASVRINT